MAELETNRRCNHCQTALVPGELLTPTATALIGTALWKSTEEVSPKIFGGRSAVGALRVRAFCCPDCGDLTFNAFDPATISDSPSEK